MSEVLIFMVVLFLAYLYLPSSWFSGIFSSVQRTDEPAVTETKTAVTPVSTESVVTKKVSLPEDSVLRRHFLTHLRAEIETGLSQRPTDSVLQRHYDAMVEAELESRLLAFAA